MICRVGFSSEIVWNLERGCVVSHRSMLVSARLVIAANPWSCMAIEVSVFEVR